MNERELENTGPRVSVTFHGATASGKSTLLRMLTKKLDQENIKWHAPVRKHYLSEEIFVFKKDLEKEKKPTPPPQPQSGLNVSKVSFIKSVGRLLEEKYPGMNLTYAMEMCLHGYIASLHERDFTAQMVVELFPSIVRNSFRKKELKKAKFI